MTLADISATTLLDDFPEPAIVMTPDGVLVQLNPAALRLFRLAQLQPGSNITDFLPERERDRLNPLAWMQRWAEQPDAPELEHVHLHCRTSDGDDIPVTVRVGRIRDQQDSYYVVLLHDIAAQQQRQTQVRLAHRLAARVLAISADAVVVADQQLNITYANPSAEKLFGYTGGALMGRQLNNLLPESYRQDHNHKVQQFAAEAAPARLMGQRSEVVGLTATGEEIPLEASITKVTLDSSVAFSAHLRDLRPRKLAELELTRSLSRFQTVFDHALQAMALIDPAGRVLEMNHSARSLLPRDAQPIGELFAQLPFFSPDPDGTRTLLEQALEACLAGEVFQIPATVRLPDGSIRELDFSLAPVIDGGETFAMIAEARDLIDPDIAPRA